VRREVWAGIGVAAAMAVLAASLRPRDASITDPPPKTEVTGKEGTASGAPRSTKSDHADYQWVVNVAAGVVTLSAGVLGVFGITGGVAVALLRNAPEAVTTASLAAGVAVLLGLASAFISPELTVGEHLRMIKRIRRAIGVLVVATLVTTAITFTSRGAPTARAQILWALFLALIGVLMLWGAREAVKGRDYRLKTLAILTSLAVFGVSVLCVVVLAAGETRAASRPAVSVTLEFKPAATSAASTTATSAAAPAATSRRGSFVLHVTVTSLGMTSDERYLVAVDRVDRRINATQVRVVYLTYVGPDAAGGVQYDFSIPVAVDKVVPWLGVSATLQHVGEPPTDPRRDPCGVEAGPSRSSGSTCALVYADPTLTSS
jgi:hypothetical protein